MMRMKTDGGGGDAAGAEWELRPSGMLVQKRNPDSDHRSIPPPTIRVRVKFGSTYHQINISSEATFGELKKMLTGPTGLHHQDQKLMYKDKERDSKAFLDVAGVKDKSKMVVVEDPIRQEKRFLEMRKNATMEKASKSISQISLEVDRLAGRVSALESVISKGAKVEEKQVLSLIELLMNELLKLDGIMGDGDVKLQRKLQVKRVQKYVETLDMLKAKNSNGTHKPSNQKQSNGHRLAVIDEEQHQEHQEQQQQQQQHPPKSTNSTGAPVVVTTQWETFDAPPLVNPQQQPQQQQQQQQQPKFPWDFFG
ncbi:BAG family molecular chaperone regulator 1 [Linum perenne]